MKKPTVKYKKLIVDINTIIDVWGLPYDDNADEGVELIGDEITGTSRWSVFHTLTVRIKGTVYQTSYSKGATEYQDEQPWQDEKTVEFIEMRPVEKVIIVWEPVLEEESKVGATT